jgi:general secretion pathway protein J
MPAHLGIGGLYRIGLSLSDGSGPRRLVMTRRLLHPDLADDDAETTMLIDGVEDIEFAYFGALDEAGPSLWHDRWGESEHLPALVRMRVDFGADSRRSWPEMVVAPKIDTLAACVYDPITKKCRNL